MTTPSTLKVADHFPDAIPTTAGSLTFGRGPLYPQDQRVKVLVFVNNQGILLEFNWNHFGNAWDNFKPEIEPLNYNSLILFAGTVIQFQSKQYSELNFVVLKQNIVLPRDKADMSTFYSSKEEVVSLLWEHFIVAQRYIIQNHLVLDPKGGARQHYCLIPQQDLVTEKDSLTPRHFLLAIVSDVVPKTETSVGPLKVFILDPTHDATSLSPSTLSPAHFKEFPIYCANTTGPGISPRVGSCVLLFQTWNKCYITYYPLLDPCDGSDATIPQESLLTLGDASNNLFCDKTLLLPLLQFHHQQVQRALAFGLGDTAYVQDYEKVKQDIYTKRAEKIKQEKQEKERQLRLHKVLPIAESYIHDFIATPKEIILKHIALLSNSHQQYPDNISSHHHQHHQHVLQLIPQAVLDDIVATLTKYEQQLLPFLQPSASINQQDDQDNNHQQALDDQQKRAEYNQLFLSYKEYCVEKLRLLIALTTATTTQPFSLPQSADSSSDSDDENDDDDLLNAVNVMNHVAPIDVSTMPLQAHTQDMLQQYHRYFNTVLYKEQLRRPKLRAALGGVDNNIHNNNLLNNLFTNNLPLFTNMSPSASPVHDFTTYNHYHISHGYNRDDSHNLSNNNNNNHHFQTTTPTFSLLSNIHTTLQHSLPTDTPNVNQQNTIDVREYHKDHVVFMQQAKIGVLTQCIRQLGAAQDDIVTLSHSRPHNNEPSTTHHTLVNTTTTSGSDSTLATTMLHALQQQLGAKDKQLAEKDNIYQQQLDAKDKQLADKDNIYQQQLAEKDKMYQQQLGEKDRIHQQQLAEKDKTHQQQLGEKDKQFQLLLEKFLSSK